MVRLLTESGHSALLWLHLLYRLYLTMAHRVGPASVRLQLPTDRRLVQPARLVGVAHRLLTQLPRSPHQVISARLLGLGLGLGLG